MQMPSFPIFPSSIDDRRLDRLIDQITSQRGLKRAKSLARSQRKSSWLNEPENHKGQRREKGD